MMTNTVNSTNTTIPQSAAKTRSPVGRLLLSSVAAVMAFQAPGFVSPTSAQACTPYACVNTHFQTGHGVYFSGQHCAVPSPGGGSLSCVSHYNAMEGFVNITCNLQGNSWCGGNS